MVIYLGYTVLHLHISDSARTKSADQHDSNGQLSTMQAFLEHIDILVFVEATIYQMDEENETLAKTGNIGEGHQLQGGCHTLRSCAAAAEAWCSARIRLTA